MGRHPLCVLPADGGAQGWHPILLGDSLHTGPRVLQPNVLQFDLLSLTIILFLRLGIRNIILGTGLIVLCAPGVLRTCPSLLGVAGMLLGCIAGIALGDSVLRLLHQGSPKCGTLSDSRLPSCL